MKLRGFVLTLALVTSGCGGSATPAFHDVPATDPAFSAVQALAASGATTGCGAGAFCPDQPITERQLATLVTALGGADDPLTIATARPATRARAAVFVAHGARVAPAPL